MGTSYGQLGLKERIEIYRLHADGKSLHVIATALGRHASTISRELRRNSKPSRRWRGGYDPQRAQSLTQRRHARGRAHKLERQPDLRKQVFDRLAMGWSPEQIAGRLTLAKGEPVISHESIYRYIYWRLWSFKENLHLLLPRRKYARGKPGRKGGGSWTERIKRRIPIAKRPQGINQRRCVGHWEADTMAFSKPGTAVLVIHERRSRFAVLRLQKDRSSLSVVTTLGEALEAFPASNRRSVTMDNGPEFSKHYLLNDRHGIKTWFCDLRSPWQKGGVENAIGRLRRFLPRKTDPDKIHSRDFVRLAALLNNTPRKCLGFLTPKEVFSKQESQRVALQT